MKPHLIYDPRWVDGTHIAEWCDGGGEWRQTARGAAYPMVTRTWRSGGWTGWWLTPVIPPRDARLVPNSAADDDPTTREMNP